MNRFIFFITLLVSFNTYSNVPKDFLPAGYKIFETLYADLNKDGQKDCVLIIKKTDEDQVIINRFEEKVDRNRRGIIVLLKNSNGYQLADKNYSCFSSENEDGGIYFAPELTITFRRGNLVVEYGHGRYGYWQYVFRYQESKMKLIGYDYTAATGPIINKETSINFLSKKKLIKENTNLNAEGGDEKFKETWSKIKIDKLIELAEIEDFDSLNMNDY